MNKQQLPNNCAPTHTKCSCVNENENCCACNKMPFTVHHKADKRFFQ